MMAILAVALIPARKPRPISSTRPPTLSQKPDGAASEADLRDELLVIDKAQVDALVKRLRKSMPRAQHRLLQTTLDAVAEKQFSARLFAQEVR
jgi:hypothetical protein